MNGERNCPRYRAAERSGITVKVSFPFLLMFAIKLTEYKLYQAFNELAELMPR